ncbi:tautomerase family protein [Candidatus Bathyarchaeota archaeon]|nr:tautomerase family protein [Candidatus Bathyarchaeota archaeon]
MYFGKGALTAEQKAELSRKVTDLIVSETKQPPALYMGDHPGKTSGKLDGRLPDPTRA